MLKETKDQTEQGGLEGQDTIYGGRNARYMQHIREMRLGDLIEKHTMESQRTIILYFINLVALVFLLLIYVGLSIIMLIALLIHWWDKYNYSDEDYGIFSHDYHDL